MTRVWFVALGLLSLITGSAQEGTASICTDSARLARLAQIDESPDAGMVRTQSGVWCAAEETGPALTWPNKRNARFESGAWNYPNGRTGKTSGGVWDYSNGRTARTSSGTWSYPDGRTAKFASGRWQRPDGKASSESELLTWACQQLGENRCRRPLGEITRLTGFDKDLAIIDLAWSAR